MYAQKYIVGWLLVRPIEQKCFDLHPLNRTCSITIRSNNIFTFTLEICFISQRVTNEAKQC